MKGEILGVLTVGDRVRGKAIGYEDRELLEVLADQVASFLMNIRLARRLRETSELEAFRNMSAFFVHDLKNLANRLSLTVQNLPRHYEKAEFREQAFRTIEQSVDKIKGMCSRLSLLREKLELVLEVRNFGESVAGICEELRPQVEEALVLERRPVGRVRLDERQFRKVVVNLVLNAWESFEESAKCEVGSANEDSGNGKRDSGNGIREEGGEGIGNSEFRIQNSEGGAGEGFEGEPPQVVAGGKEQSSGSPASRFPLPASLPKPLITVRTLRDDRWAVLEVEDNGCGMEREFIDERLFQPFQTTKKQGMGIGLFQSRMIVEAHGGRIEVESTPGVGTLFRVRIPRVEG